MSSVNGGGAQSTATEVTFEALTVPLPVLTLQYSAGAHRAGSPPPHADNKEATTTHDTLATKRLSITKRSYGKESRYFL